MKSFRSRKELHAYVRDKILDHKVRVDGRLLSTVCPSTYCVGSALLPTYSWILGSSNIAGPDTSAEGALVTPWFPRRREGFQMALERVRSNLALYTPLQFPARSRLGESAP